MIEDDVTTPLTRIFAAHLNAELRGTKSAYKEDAFTTISKVWFSGTYSHDSYILAAEDWKVKVTIPRMLANARSLGLESIAKLVKEVEIIENEDNIVRDLGFLRLKGHEELFKPIA